jgi:hypothetical protein
MMISPAGPKLPPVLEFIQTRQKFCQLALDVVAPTKIADGDESQCFMNAYRGSSAHQCTMCSGWLATPLQRGTAFQFTQHWWNFDQNAYRYIDHSPAIEENAVYILDQDLAQFTVVHNDRLTSCVARSLVLEQGQFFAIETIESSYQFKPLDDLSTETLFEPYLLR